jgi:hypothetical protein
MIILIPLLTSHPLFSCVIDVAFDRSILLNSIISWFSMIFPLGLVLTQCHRLNVRFLLLNGGVFKHHLWLPVISSHRSFFSLSRLSSPPWLLLFALSYIPRDWLWPRFIYFVSLHLSFHPIPIIISIVPSLALCSSSVPSSA